MAFEYINKKNQKYFLHKKLVQLKGSGKQQMIYFFSKVAGDGAINEVPEGYGVVENKKTGLPVLKRQH